MSLLQCKWPNNSYFYSLSFSFLCLKILAKILQVQILTYYYTSTFGSSIHYYYQLGAWLITSYFNRKIPFKYPNKRDTWLYGNPKRFRCNFFMLIMDETDGTAHAVCAQTNWQNFQWSLSLYSYILHQPPTETWSWFSARGWGLKTPLEYQSSKIYRMNITKIPRVHEVWCLVSI